MTCECGGVGCRCEYLDGRHGTETEIIMFLREVELASTSEIAQELDRTLNAVYLCLRKMAKAGRVTKRLWEDYSAFSEGQFSRTPDTVWYLVEG